MRLSFDELTFEEALKKDLRVMDGTAFALSGENKIPMIVFDIDLSGNLMRIVKGEKVGTWIS